MPAPVPADLQRAARDHERLRDLVRADLARAPARIVPIPAGLGTRRFHRLYFEDGATPTTLIGRIEAEASQPTAVATPRSPVPEAPAWLSEPPLEPLRSFLEEAGLRVPYSYAHRPDQGIDLLEDVGDQTLAQVVPAERPRLTLEACAIPPRLQALRAAADEVPAFGRRFDRALVRTKAWKWLHWTLPLLLGREASRAETEATDRLFDQIAALAESAPLRLSHRDFKAENLHLVASPTRSERSPRHPREIVMIDIQGAFLAPPEYDLVCLLYDLQVEFEEDFIRQAFLDTLPRLPDAPDPDQASLRFDALAVARLAKDVSHVVHAGVVRGDRRRWHELPRGLALLDRAAQRLGRTFSEVEALTSVIQALTPAAHSADRGSRGAD